MKTVSLELSKQLKEAGYPQKSYMWWVHVDEEPYLVIEDMLNPHGENEISSPTADELLDHLPMMIQRHDRTGELEIKRYNESKGYWGLWYAEPRGDIVGDSIGGECLADAAAKMWIYLKEKGLLGVTQNE